MNALVDYLREFNEDLRQFNEDLEREANGECKVDRTVQPLEPLRSLLVRLLQGSELGMTAHCAYVDTAYDRQNCSAAQVSLT